MAKTKKAKKRARKKGKRASNAKPELFARSPQPTTLPPNEPTSAAEDVERGTAGEL